MMGQLGFAEAFLADKAGQNRRLERIASLIDWSPFEAILPRAAAPGPGRPSYPALAMFKALLLAQWYHTNPTNCRVALVGAARRALASREPAMADATLLADARLVLEKQADFLARMCISNRLQPVTEPP